MKDKKIRMRIRKQEMKMPGWFTNRKVPKEDTRRARIPLVWKILMIIGLITVIYLFITEILMRILAALTP